MDCLFELKNTHIGYSEKNSDEMIKEEDEVKPEFFLKFRELIMEIN